MNVITLDFETYFDDDYTLSKMTTESYIRDPRFEALGVAIKWCMPDPPCGYAQGETWWYGPKELNGDKNCELPVGSIFDCVDWSNTAVLAHHAQFDGLILSHHYGIKPKFWFDTLSMARLLLGNHLSVGLDSLAKHFGLAGKKIDYFSFKGKHWQDMSETARQMLAVGCCHDVEITWCLFEKIMRGQS